MSKNNRNGPTFGRSKKVLFYVKTENGDLNSLSRFLLHRKFLCIQKKFGRHPSQQIVQFWAWRVENKQGSAIKNNKAVNASSAKNCSVRGQIGIPKDMKSKPDEDQNTKFSLYDRERSSLICQEPFLNLLYFKMWISDADIRFISMFKPSLR